MTRHLEELKNIRRDKENDVEANREKFIDDLNKLREKHKEELDELEKESKEAKRKNDVLETVVREERSNFLVKEQELSVEIASSRQSILQLEREVNELRIERDDLSDKYSQKTSELKHV